MRLILFIAALSTASSYAAEFKPVSCPPHSLWQSQAAKDICDVVTAYKKGVFTANAPDLEAAYTKGAVYSGVYNVANSQENDFYSGAASDLLATEVGFPSPDVEIKITSLKIEKNGEIASITLDERNAVINEADPGSPPKVFARHFTDEFTLMKHTGDSNLNDAKSFGGWKIISKSFYTYPMGK